MSLKGFKSLVGKNPCQVSRGQLKREEAKVMLQQGPVSQYLNGTCRYFPLT